MHSLHSLSIEKLKGSPDCVVINHDLQQQVYRGSHEQCSLAIDQYNKGFRPEFEDLSFNDSLQSFLKLAEYLSL